MKGNYLVLNEDQLKAFNERYVISIVGDKISTKTKDYKRVTLHSIEDGFQAIIIMNNRKITFKITPRAIKLWMNEKFNDKYSLIDIQNIINKVIVSHQVVTDEDIFEELNK